ncbi:hypothetical protein [Streptomyces sp. NPDC058240]|uniref:hypothetical protein n=1 Tax=Streptomyces sp. NPDC058240 TaxID=3346396 RepID=UPI0036EDB2B1
MGADLRPGILPGLLDPVGVLDAELTGSLDSTGGGFGWSYNGTGTSNAAAVILANALGLGNPYECGISFLSDEDKTLGALREDFCDDGLSQCCDQWRLRRGVVLRWARAWYLQQGITDLPAALHALPPLYGKG